MLLNWRALALTILMATSLCAPARGATEFVEVPLPEPVHAPGPEDAARPPRAEVAQAETTLQATIPGSLLDLPDAELIMAGGNCAEMLEDLALEYLPEGRVLTLDEAISLTVASSAELSALALEVDAGLAREVQAGLRANPELDIGLSEFFGMNERRLFRHSVSSVTYSKLIEDSCKRSSRLALAATETELARWNYQVRLREIQQGVAVAYVEVLVAQYEAVVSHELLRLTEIVREDVQLRYEAGTVPRLDVRRIDVEIANARLLVDQASREMEASRRRLSALWNDLTPDFTRVTGLLTDTPAPPTIEALAAVLPETPGVLRFGLDLERREAALALALANVGRDYRVRGGVEGFGDSGEMALTVGVTIPLQRGNRNQGAIAEAEVLIEQLGEERLAQLRTIQLELVEAHTELVNAFAHADAICSNLIPAAQETYAGTLLGYRHGKFENIELLDSERVLVQALQSYVEALGNYQRARAQVERLIAAPIESVDPASAKSANPEYSDAQPAAEINFESTRAAEPAPPEETITLGEGNG